MNIGSIAVEGPRDKMFNRGYMLSDTGGIVGRYDKIHLFDVNLSDTAIYRESDTVEPGKDAVMHETPFGRIGHTICYDLRFGQLYRALAQAGADILTCPAAFTKTTGEAHWHILLRARAIETGAFVIAAAQTGTHADGRETWGHSLVISPWGEVLLDMGDAPGLAFVDLDLTAVEKARAQIQSLTHDRAYEIKTV